MPDWGDLLVDQLRFMARRYGDEVAYRDLGSGHSITFRGWDARSNALARGLARRGVRPGDRASIYLPSDECLRWIVAYAAVHKAGAVAVPTNTRLSVRELTAILGHAEVRALLTSASLLGNARDVSRALPSLELVVTDRAEPAEISWEDAFDADDGDYQAPVESDDLADIMYTSGTTALPKGVAVRHGNVAMIPNNEPPWTGAGWLHGAPLFTFAGISFIYNPMKMGMRGLYQPKFDAGEWLRIVARERPTMAFLVPAMSARSFDRQRTACPEHAACVARAASERDRVELVRHDRSRPGVHRHAERGSDKAHRLGRQADPTDGDQDRRRGRPGVRGGPGR
jgi:acyl-CoA synthetase (AMP-forming)/AMP-acid ligase II